MDQKKSIREYLIRYNRGEFAAKDVDTQIAAGWYDWFCKDSSLAGRTIKLTSKLKTIVLSPKIDLDKMYVFFKNNCPMVGTGYDDFRICDMATGKVIFTVTPSNGHDSIKGQASVWGSENKFEKPLAEGTWDDVMNYFLGIE